MHLYQLKKEPKHEKHVRFSYVQTSAKIRKMHLLFGDTMNS
jgi:hypothetical protein